MHPTTLILLALICGTFGPITCWVAQAPPDPNYPNNCNAANHGLGLMKLGEEKRAKDACVQVSCHKDGGMTLTGCGSIGVAKPCYVTDEDLSKPHPQCCPKPKCPEKI